MSEDCRELARRCRELECRLKEAERQIEYYRKVAEETGRRRLREIHQLSSLVAEQKKAQEERKRLEAKLIQAQKMEAIGTLAGGIAHDFNNILMGIQGCASLVLMRMDPSNPNYKHLKSIVRQVKSGARLTSQLLGYARKGRYEVRPIDLNQLVLESSETFGRARKDISVHCLLAPDLLPVDADQGQMEQVFLNLFTNAADAMPGGGDLVLRTSNVTHRDIRGGVYEPRPGNYVMVEVTDTGEGMDEATMKRIFEPFFTTRQMGRGTGLGLASVYGIVKAHNGYIEVESRPGEGSTFKVFLPASLHKIKGVPEQGEEVATGTGTILLVDDEELVLDVGKELLEEIGYTVVPARSGKEALEIYRARGPEVDLVILDLIMPGMGGAAVFEELKAIAPGVKVLLTSGYSKENQAARVLEQGCDGFIQKPFDLSKLSRKIKEILSGRQA